MDKTIIDLFAGAGGWDEGLRELRLSALGIDCDAWACATATCAACACASGSTMIENGSPNAANSGTATQRLSAAPAKITTATLKPTM